MSFRVAIAPTVAAYVWCSPAAAEARLAYDLSAFGADASVSGGSSAPVLVTNERVRAPSPNATLEDERGFSISGALSAVSDYRFRGVSLSNGRPVPQAGLAASYGPLSAGIWTSRIERTAGGSRQEVDLSLAAATSVGGLDLTGTGLLYLYPGDGDARYAELALSASRRFGSFSASAGFAWAPSQSALRGENNYYANLGSTWENRLATFSATAGHEWGSFAPRGKWDWSLTASRPIGPINVSLSYVDSDARVLSAHDRNLAGSTAVVGISLNH